MSERLYNIGPISNLDFTTAVRDEMIEGLSKAIQYGSAHT